MSGPPVSAQKPRLFTPEFTSLLTAQAGFGYAFSSFFMLPKYMDIELGAGPAPGSPARPGQVS